LYFSGVSDSEKNELKWDGNALEALTLLESCERPLFITGKAGTGKSTLLRYFTSKNRDKNLAVLAPTGVAALNARGQTIHSFFRFPHHPVHSSQIKKVSKTRRKFYENLDMIIIDEISMVRADLLDNMDVFLRKNGPSPGMPFGGVRMVFFGDLFQLPPVIAHEIEEQLMALLYETPYFFSASVLEKTGLKTISLEKVYRQKDTEFMEILNAVRHNDLLPRQLERLNSRYIPDFKIPQDAFYITLTATNRKAASINEQRLAALAGKEYFYEAKRSGTFPDRLSPNDEELKLKEGAQVMFIRNDPQRRWVNGSIGKVSGMDEDKVLVELVDSGLEYEVEKVEWEMLKYQFDEKKHTIEADVIGTFSQLPIRPAWAITIHKSQGKTFEKVIIDTGRGAFASGQIYVALSRCTSLEGIVLKQRIRPEEIKIDERVLEFAASQRI